MVCLASGDAVFCLTKTEIDSVPFTGQVLAGVDTCLRNIPVFMLRDISKGEMSCLLNFESFLIPFLPLSADCKGDTGFWKVRQYALNIMLTCSFAKPSVLDFLKRNTSSECVVSPSWFQCMHNLYKVHFFVAAVEYGSRKHFVGFTLWIPTKGAVDCSNGEKPSEICVLLELSSHT